MGLFGAPPLETQCTILIEHSADHLHAHVELDGNLELGPGDAVKVHGDPVRLPFGEALTLRRDVTVWKAGAIKRWWTQLRAQTELTELYEITFSSEKTR